MAGLPHSSTLDELGERPFSFYPPILNIEHNEWRMVRGTWSEILVSNSGTTLDVWIPRSFLGEISQVDKPVMIVGLRKELEYKGGSVWPHARRVVAMPRAGTGVPAPDAGSSLPPARVSELRRSEGTESRIGRLILGVLAVGLVACFLVVAYFKRSSEGGAVEYRGVLQLELGLHASDDYFDVVRKLGAPSEDRWQSETGERQIRALIYKDKNLVIILMGPDRNGARYIGAKDSMWRNVHSVILPGGHNTNSILRAIKRF